MESSAIERQASCATILYIEDDPASADLVATILRSRSNTRLIHVATGEEGLRTALSDRPQLILLDMRLPDTSGADLLNRLRSEHETREIPVIVFSAETREENPDVRSPLVDDYITKPLDDIPQFLAAVERSLEG